MAEDMQPTDEEMEKAEEIEKATFGRESPFPKPTMAEIAGADSMTSEDWRQVRVLVGFVIVPSILFGALVVGALWWALS